uniref:Uncharacterized protein n=1 Tax=Macrostomum lignano TaxID=282301 RepID=A0A1I8FPG1_9PLAT
MIRCWRPSADAGVPASEAAWRGLLSAQARLRLAAIAAVGKPRTMSCFGCHGRCKRINGDLETAGESRARSGLRRSCEAPDLTAATPSRLPAPAPAPACQTNAATQPRLFFRRRHSDSAMASSLASGIRLWCLSDRGIGVTADGAATGSCHAHNSLPISIVKKETTENYKTASRLQAVRRVAKARLLCRLARRPPPCLGGPTAPPPLVESSSLPSPSTGFTLDFAASAAAAAAASSAAGGAPLWPEAARRQRLLQLPEQRLQLAAETSLD